MRHSTAPLRFLPLLSVVGALALGGCGATQTGAGDPGSANPASRATAADFKRALGDAPPALAAVYAKGDSLLDGGTDAFQAQLQSLRGHPVVVNKWASWCGPCRFEFPALQAAALRYGDRVAFLGVDSNDSDDAAETFLDELPLPYPSYKDPDQEIAELFDAREFPTTVFYDSQGELVYARRGGYGSEDELVADIQKYAR
jgi:thiol-disulfide isomerase/thioredoxin